MNEEMIIQKDQEFQLNKMKKLNLKYNVQMFSIKLRGSKAFTVEKIREFKKTII